jgi:hypothetical protein
MESSFCIEALEEALSKNEKPEILKGLRKKRHC